MRAGSLAVLGAVFVSAFVGRAAVLAAEVAGAPSERVKKAAPASPQCVTGALAEELKAELDKLETRKLDLADEEATGKLILSHIEKRIAELEAANASLQGSLTKVENQKAGEERRVAAIYEQMKPQLAGSIIGAMDPEFAAGLLLSMNGESASGVLASLPPERAYQITVLMASAR